MANMSYCRWQNTLEALGECAQALEQREPLSRAERRAAVAVMQLAVEMLQELHLDVDTDGCALEAVEVALHDALPERE